MYRWTDFVRVLSTINNSVVGDHNILASERKAQ